MPSATGAVGKRRALAPYRSRCRFREHLRILIIMAHSLSSRKMPELKLRPCASPGANALAPKELRLFPSIPTPRDFIESRCQRKP